MIDTGGVFELLSYHELDLTLDHLVEIRKQVPLKKLRTLRNLHLSLRSWILKFVIFSTVFA
jgi:hypothetical protein